MAFLFDIVPLAPSGRLLLIHLESLFCLLWFRINLRIHPALDYGPGLYYLLSIPLLFHAFASCYHAYRSMILLLLMTTVVYVFSIWWLLRFMYFLCHCANISDIYLLLISYLFLVISSRWPPWSMLPLFYIINQAARCAVSWWTPRFIYLLLW